MISTATPMLPERGKFRRALAAVLGWLEAMDYNTGDCTVDRVDRLEREVRRLKDELLQVRDLMAIVPPDGQAAALKD